MRVALRILVLVACVPLLIPPGVCTCDDGDEQRHPHGHHHRDSCVCLGSLGLDADHTVHPAKTFDPPIPVDSRPERLELPAETAPAPRSDASPFPCPLPRYLTQQALLL